MTAHNTHSVKSALTLAQIATISRANSERWFPVLHARSWDDLAIHYVLGLVGEAGEVADLQKKAGTGRFDVTNDQFAAELADVFTYLVLLAHHAGVDLIDAWQRKQAVCEERWGS